MALATAIALHQWDKGAAQPLIKISTTANNPGQLPLCAGDCDHDKDCVGDLICYQRGPFESVPSCQGGEADSSRTDYCISLQDFLDHPETSLATSLSPMSVNMEDSSPPSVTPFFPPVQTPIAERPLNTERKKIKILGGDPPIDHRPLQRCDGDCDGDDDCADDLVCFQKGPYMRVPGCIGGSSDTSKTDYCIDPRDLDQDESSNDDENLVYVPGHLNKRKLGLLLSQGLDVKLIATSGDLVQYSDGGSSTIPFHGRPDAGATFPDTRAGNLGGFVYVSNAEMRVEGEGGVGSITFDKDGNVIDYRMILEGTSMNCGGGRTPWNTWVSCEEKHDRSGNAFQVDPLGTRPAERMTMGSYGGRWESFAYEDRAGFTPRFYMTEDHPRGALLRFIPTVIDWDDPWRMLHGQGTRDYLKLNGDGTFAWTIKHSDAMDNARQRYPDTEGIDVRGSELLFVSKSQKMLFTLDLDANTWEQASTQSGLLDGQPDQLQRIIESPRDLLYFTEEGGRSAGFHARDEEARFYTIMESASYPGETSGLALSPDARFMFVAYQDVGKVFCIWRMDRGIFGAEHLDIKFHEIKQ